MLVEFAGTLGRGPPDVCFIWKYFQSLLLQLLSPYCAQNPIFTDLRKSVPVLGVVWTLFGVMTVRDR